MALLPLCDLSIDSEVRGFFRDFRQHHRRVPLLKCCFQRGKEGNFFQYGNRNTNEFNPLIRVSFYLLVDLYKFINLIVILIDYSTQCGRPMGIDGRLGYPCSCLNYILLTRL